MGIIFKKIRIPVGLVLLALATRAPFISASPCGWDSAGYLCWCKDFLYYGIYHISHITKLQYSHPAYYLLLDLSSLFSKLTGIISVEKSAALVSVLLGSAAVAPFYYISMYLFRKRSVALVSGLFFIFCPALWFFSENIVSEMPNLFFMLAGLAFMLKWRDMGEATHLAWGSVFTGVSLLVRPASLLILPVFFLLVLQGCIERKNFKPVIMSMLVFVPYALGLLWQVFVMNVPIGFLLSKTNQHDFSLARLMQAETWVFFLKVMSNSLTPVFFILALLGFIQLVIPSKRKLEIKSCHPEFVSGSGSEMLNRVQHDKTPSSVTIWFIIIWIIPYTLFWRSMPISNHHVRLAVFLLPPFLLAGSQALAYIIEKIHAGESLFYAAAVLLSVQMAFFTVPLVAQYSRRISSEQAMAMWLAQNTPKNSLVLAGTELPLYWCYAKPRQVVLADDKFRPVEHIARTVGKARHENPAGQARVFTFSTPYAESYMPRLMDIYRFKIVDIIPAWNLRRQQDAETTYLDYKAIMNPERIRVYEITPPGKKYFRLKESGDGVQISHENREKTVIVDNAPACRGIRIESVMGRSVNVKQGEEIAVITVNGRGAQAEFSLKAGLDTAEFAYNRPDVKKKILHRRAGVSNLLIEKYEGGVYCSHVFYTEKYFGKVFKPEKIEFTYRETSAVEDKPVLLIKKILLIE